MFERQGAEADAYVRQRLAQLGGRPGERLRWWVLGCSVRGPGEVLGRGSRAPGCLPPLCKHIWYLTDPSAWLHRGRRLHRPSVRGVFDVIESKRRQLLWSLTGDWGWGEEERSFLPPCHAHQAMHWVLDRGLQGQAAYQRPEHLRPHAPPLPADVRSKLLPVLLEWDLRQQGQQAVGGEGEVSAAAVRAGPVPPLLARGTPSGVEQQARSFPRWAACARPTAPASHHSLTPASCRWMRTALLTMTALHSFLLLSCRPSSGQPRSKRCTARRPSTTR